MLEARAGQSLNQGRSNGSITAHQGEGHPGEVTGGHSIGPVALARLLLTVSAGTVRARPHRLATIGRRLFPDVRKQLRDRFDALPVRCDA